MRRLVRFLRGLLLLGVAATALVLVVLSCGDARAEPQGLDAGVPVSEAGLGVSVWSPALPVPAPVELRTLLRELPAVSLAAPASPKIAPPQPPSTVAPSTPAEPAGPAAVSESILPRAAPLPEGTPGTPATPTPALPVVVPTIDVNALTAVVGGVPQLPAVSALAALPSSPPPVTPEPSPDPQRPEPAQVAASLPEAPGSLASPHLAPAAVLPVPAAQSTLVPTTAAGTFPLFDDSSTPVRAPPGQLPVHPCPHGDTPHLSSADAAVVLTPCGNDAPLRTHLRADARAYASSSLVDPLLRPD
jgi:hypothetical protein